MFVFLLFVLRMQVHFSVEHLLSDLTGQPQSVMHVCQTCRKEHNSPSGTVLFSILFPSTLDFRQFMADCYHGLYQRGPGFVE